MTQKKFNYYVTEEHTLKPMNHFQALQLDKDFFSKFDEEQFKKHVRKLYLEYHPDRNPESKAESDIAFKRIIEAVDVMMNPDSRNQYLLFGTENSSQSRFEDRYTHVVDWLQDTLDKLDLLEKQIDLFPQKKEGVEEKANSSSLVPTSNQLTAWSYQDVATRLNHLWQGGMVFVSQLEKQMKVFHKLEGRAKTGGDFYALFNIAFRDAQLNYHSRQYLHEAAARGHWVAMRTVAGSALNGLYSTPKDASIIWALNCIRYLEAIAVPKLQESSSEQAKKDLKEIQEGLIRARSRIDSNGVYAQGKTIPPENSEEFTILAQSILHRIQNEGSIRKFNLSNNMFSILEKSDDVNDESTLNQLIEEFEKAKTQPEVVLLKRANADGPVCDNVQLELMNDSVYKTQEKQQKDVVLKALREFYDYLEQHYHGRLPEGTDTFYERAIYLCNYTPTMNSQEDYNRLACIKIAQLATQSFSHRHSVLRILADMVFIPLGLMTLGVAFAVKYHYTGSMTFFGEKTHRQEKLEEFLGQIPKSPA